MNENLNKLEAHFKVHIDMFEGLGIYFWIASGSIRDFVTGDNPADIDFFFSSKQDMLIARNKIVEIGAKKIMDLPEGRGEKFKCKDNIYDLACWSGAGDPPCEAKTPQKMIGWFDYTVEMAALDSLGVFYSHPDFFEDCKNKRLVRNSIRDFYPRANNRRLLKYIKNGYTIDQDNLLIWLEDQEATFEYRQKLRK